MREGGREGEKREGEEDKEWVGKERERGTGED